MNVNSDSTSNVNLEELVRQVNEKLENSIQDAIKKIYADVDKKNSGLAASLNKDFEKKLQSVIGNLELNPDLISPEEKTTSENSEKTTSIEAEKNVVSNSTKLSLKALETQQKQLAEKMAEAEQRYQESQLNLRREKIKNSLSKTFSNLPVTDIEAAQVLFNSYFGDNINLDEESGEVYIQKGEDVLTLSDAANNFLESNLGKAVRRIPKGSGLQFKETKSTKPKLELSLNERLFVDD